MITTAELEHCKVNGIGTLVGDLRGQPWTIIPRCWGVDVRHCSCSLEDLSIARSAQARVPLPDMLNPLFEIASRHTWMPVM